MIKILLESGVDRDTAMGDLANAIAQFILNKYPEETPARISDFLHELVNEELFEIMLYRAFEKGVLGEWLDW